MPQWLDFLGWNLYFIVVLGGIGAVVGLVAGSLAAAVFRNGWRGLSWDMVLGALVLYGGYRLRDYLRLHGLLEAYSRQWLDFLVAGLAVVAHEGVRFLLRRSTR